MLLWVGVMMVKKSNRKETKFQFGVVQLQQASEDDGHDREGGMAIITFCLCLVGVSISAGPALYDYSQEAVDICILVALPTESYLHSSFMSLEN
jgi:hypothetical protein